MTQFTPKEKPRSIKLVNIPEDVYCIILQEQAKIKGARRIGMFGMEKTVYSIIREHKRCETK